MRKLRSVRMGSYPEVIKRAFMLSAIIHKSLIPQLIISVFYHWEDPRMPNIRESLNEIVTKISGTEVSRSLQKHFAYMNKEHPELLEKKKK